MMPLLILINAFLDRVDGLENYRKILWTQQLHIFEVPFYYIEYGMAQLGALSIYMNYRQDKQKHYSNIKIF